MTLIPALDMAMTMMRVIATWKLSWLQLLVVGAESQSQSPSHS